MALLKSSPVPNFCSYQSSSQGWNLKRAPTAGRRATGGGSLGLVSGGRNCRCIPPRKDYYPRGVEATNRPRAGAGGKSGSLVSSLLAVDKKRRGGQRVLDPGVTHDELYLPGIELGNPVGGDTAPLLYKPFMDHLLSTLTEKAPDFKSLDLEPDFTRQVSKVGATSTVFNWLFSASRLRRIRMTYFDGGSALQAFNSLLYPDFMYDVPLLGIDLLSFGSSKILCVVDFTPLSQDPAYLDKYTSQLAPSRAKIAKYCGRMSTKFYDENQFFSKQLIFYRSELGAKDPILEVPNGLLFSTYADYIDRYLQILQAAEPNEEPLGLSYVASRQNAYNKHSEERDPAIKIFNKHYGEEWSERFTREFLFQQSPLRGDDSSLN